VIERFRVQPPDPWAPVASLSGGNQQKVMIGRELSRALKVLVVAQPTRGVDLGARAEIHAALAEARDKGVGVLLRHRVGLPLLLAPVLEALLWPVVSVLLLLPQLPS
jgi:ABC-type uncharacterized transport system ATPase subunit